MHGQHFDHPRHMDPLHILWRLPHIPTRTQTYKHTHNQRVTLSRRDHTVRDVTTISTRRDHHTGVVTTTSDVYGPRSTSSDACAYHHIQDVTAAPTRRDHQFRDVTTLSET